MDGVAHLPTLFHSGYAPIAAQLRHEDSKQWRILARLTGHFESAFEKGALGRLWQVWC